MKVYFSRLLIFIAFLFHNLSAETIDANMIAEGDYTLEYCAVLRCTGSTAMLDAGDFPVRSRGYIVAILKFCEDSQFFLVQLNTNGASNEWVEQNLHMLLHEEWIITKDVACTYEGKPVLWSYHISSAEEKNQFELFDSWFAFLTGELLFEM